MKKIVILAFSAILFAALMPAFAIEEAEETEFAYGTVGSIDISSGIIIIKEQDYDTGIERDGTYYLDPDTDFENIGSIDEIVSGNDVDISYIVKEDGRKLIKFISVYKPELEAEEE